jgi:hypothetical protein
MRLVPFDGFGVLIVHSSSRADGSLRRGCGGADRTRAVAVGWTLNRRKAPISPRLQRLLIDLIKEHARHFDDVDLRRGENSGILVA